MANGQVVYDKDGVFVHPEDDKRTVNIGGCGQLRIIEACYGVVIEWAPIGKVDEVEVGSASSVNDGGWHVLDPKVGFKFDKANEVVEAKLLSSPITCEIVDLKSLKISSTTQGWPRITLLQKDGTTHPTLHFHTGGHDGFLETLRKYVCIRQSTKEADLHLVTDPKVEALQKSLTELNLFDSNPEAVVRKFLRNPYAETMTHFSKVYKLWNRSDYRNASRPDNEMMEYVPDNLPVYEVYRVSDHGFEIISCSKLGERPTVKRGPPLNEDQWISSFDFEGRLSNLDELKSIIFHGGVVDSIRHEVWKCLLGVHDYSKTQKEREDDKKKKTDDYFRMKLQWKNFDEDQLSRFTALREHRSLVEKDVLRTDRANKNYAGENNENVALLFDILVTHCMYNFDLGYVQGMSDLLSPILLVMKNEVDTFWCFAQFMKKVGDNFDEEQQGIKRQLAQLHTLLNYLDSELGAYLELKESGNLYFCFRWLLVLCKREFELFEIMRLWEVFWTGLPCKNFHLVFCFAILDTEKNTIIENGYGVNEILKHMNDMSRHIKLDETLCKAESIYLQILNGKYVPTSVTDILGLPAMDYVTPPPAAGRSQSTRATRSLAEPPPQQPDFESDELEEKFETSIAHSYS
ncbi:hypothetical protein CHUAL_004475 [Chamberlinius hualienensis]